MNEKQDEQRRDVAIDRLREMTSDESKTSAFVDLDVIQAAIDAYDDLAARRQHDIREAVIYRRGLDPDEDNICSKCQGAGVRAYPSTATWHGGIGGAMITTDVCNKCWGSGNEEKPWPSHRYALDPATIRREEREQTALDLEAKADESANEGAMRTAAEYRWAAGAIRSLPDQPESE